MEYTKYKKKLKEIKKEASSKHKEIIEKYNVIDSIDTKKVEKA